MKRVQIYLETRQKARLEALSRRQGRSVAEIIREIVDRFLDSGAEVPDDDPLFRLVGAGGDLDRAKDISRRHHDYLRRAQHWRCRRR